MYTAAKLQNGSLTVCGIDSLDLARSFSCGQSFRWKAENGGFFGVAYGRGATARQSGSALTITPCLPGDEALWIDYFDLDRDYGAIESAIACNARIAGCLPHAAGIRVFNQEPFEALITFILSANNNAKRIAGIVDRLCGAAGEQASCSGRTYHRFPAPEAIARLTLEDLLALGAGYRAPFIRASARRVADGYDLDALRGMDLDSARRELLRFDGVGPKVADCVLLFSLGHTDAFPVDVWIDRAMRELFFGGSAPKRSELRAEIAGLGALSGILQQYLFHYARQIKLGKA